MDILPEEHSGVEIPAIIMHRTWEIRYNPGCPKKFELRLIGKGRGVIDRKTKSRSNDRIGYGNTVLEAAMSIFGKNLKDEDEITYVS